MAEEPPLERLKSGFDLIRERANYALRVIAEFEEVKSLRWRCLVCGHVKGFTRRVPVEAAYPCPKCRGSDLLKTEVAPASIRPAYAGGRRNLERTSRRDVFT